MSSNLEKLVKKISKKTDLSQSEIEKKIEEKVEEFSGLISKEGAVYIVAKELGIELLKKTEKELKIKNIVSDMNSVNTLGRVIQIFEPREFNKKNGKGKVCNIILADETDSIRMSLWDEQVNLIERDEIEEGDIVKIINGYVKEDNRGNRELRVGNSGKIKRGKGDLPSIKELKTNYSISNKGRVDLNNISPGTSCKIKGSLVQIFNSNPIFTICPKCKKSIENGKCEEHGDVDPKKSIVINGIIDDGKGNIRVVFFNDNVEKLLGESKEEIIELINNKEGRFELGNYFGGILNREYFIKGKCKINKFSDRLEFIANDVKKVNPIKESKEIIKKLE